MASNGPHRFDSTYEGLKLEDGAKIAILCTSFDSTYEGLKRGLIRETDTETPQFRQYL